MHAAVTQRELHGNGGLEDAREAGRADRHVHAPTNICTQAHKQAAGVSEEQRGREDAARAVTQPLLPASCVLGRTGDGWQSDSLLLAVTRHRIAE